MLHDLCVNIRLSLNVNVKSLVCSMQYIRLFYKCEKSVYLWIKIIWFSIYQCYNTIKRPILSAGSLICRGRNMLCFSYYVQTRLFKIVFTFLSLFLALVFFIHFLLTLIFVHEIFLSVYMGTCNETKKNDAWYSEISFKKTSE
jgi:hypothetical protein